MPRCEIPLTNICAFYNLFTGDAEILVYFYAPLGLLFVINLILFAATTRELTCGLWKREGVKSTTERYTILHTSTYAYLLLKHPRTRLTLRSIFAIIRLNRADNVPRWKILFSWDLFFSLSFVKTRGDLSLSWGLISGQPKLLLIIRRDRSEVMDLPRCSIVEFLFVSTIRYKITTRIRRSLW